MIFTFVVHTIWPNTKNPHCLFQPKNYHHSYDIICHNEVHPSHYKFNELISSKDSQVQAQVQVYLLLLLLLLLLLHITKESLLHANTYSTDQVSPFLQMTANFTGL